MQATEAELQLKRKPQNFKVYSTAQGIAMYLLMEDTSDKEYLNYSTLLLVRNLHDVSIKKSLDVFDLLDKLDRSSAMYFGFVNESWDSDLTEDDKIKTKSVLADPNIKSQADNEYMTLCKQISTALLKGYSSDLEDDFSHAVEVINENLMLCYLLEDLDLLELSSYFDEVVSH